MRSASHVHPAPSLRLPSLLQCASAAPASRAATSPTSSTASTSRACSTRTSPATSACAAVGAARASSPCRCWGSLLLPPPHPRPLLSCLCSPAARASTTSCTTSTSRPRAARGTTSCSGTAHTDARVCGCQHLIGTAPPCLAIMRRTTTLSTRGARRMACGEISGSVVFPAVGIAQ